MRAAPHPIKFDTKFVFSCVLCLVTRACGFVASSVCELAFGLSVVLVYDASLCVSGCNSLEARFRLFGRWS